eukprot:m.96641 g.96641  ORF g.96641 m.96641 type:complete len:838 (+) comp13076_c0_seq1:67-2580(+)
MKRAVSSATMSVVASALWMVLCIQIALASPNGVVIQMNGHYVELAVASKSGFRVSISNDTIKGGVPTPIVAWDEIQPASFTPITNGAVKGIKTSFGSITIDTNTAAFVMKDDAGNTLIDVPSLSPALAPSSIASPPLNDDVCKKATDGVDAQGGTRSQAAPNGLSNQTQTSCCNACNAASDCDFFVYALPSSPDPSGANCWLLNNVPGTFQRPGRISGGDVPLPPGAFQFTLSSSSSARFYGAGGGAGAPLAQTSSSAVVQNTRFQVPYYWSTDGYNALGVSQLNYSAQNLPNYPAGWQQQGQQVVWTIGASPQADLYLTPAPTPYKALDHVWDITGRPKVLPLYAYGFLACRWGWVNQTYIQSMLTQFRTGNFPIDAFISDFEWYTPEPDYNLPDSGSPTFQDFDYNNITFPSPVANLQTYRDKLNIRFGGIRKPRLGNSQLLVMAKNNGWLVGGGGRNLNYSIAEVRDWYNQQQNHYHKDGVEFWWNDEGETMYFTFFWWNQAEYDGLKKFNSTKRFFTINRSYSPGMQRFGLAAWTGDINVDWQSLQQQPGYQANWIAAGVSYVTCDTGGFNGQDDTPLLLTRWYQTAVFLGVMRVHSTHDDLPHFPFLYGPEAATAMRKAMNLRYQLIPLHYSLSHEQYSNGRPVFRPMYFDYPNDESLQETTTQWMDGDSLLVAPVMNQDNSSNVYLPNGTWFNFNTSAPVMTGPKSLNMTNVALDTIPMYVKAGGIIPLAPLVQYTDALPGGPLSIQVYGGDNGAFTLYEDDGSSTAYISGAVKKTAFEYDDSTKTLSWTQTGPQMSNEYASVDAVLFNVDGTSNTAPIQPLTATGSIQFS